MANKPDDVYTQMKVSIEREDVKGIEKSHWNRQERKQWATGLFAGCGVLYACRTVTPLCVAAMAKEFGWDKTQSGSVLSCFFWGYTMTQFLGGYLADRIGGDVVLPIAACFWSMITFWTPQLAYLSTDKYVTLHVLVISRVFLGVFQGGYMPSLTSLVGEFVPSREKSFYSAVMVSGQYFGTLLCGSVGSILLELYGWQSVFYFAGIASICWMLALRYLLIGRHRTKYLPIVSVGEIGEKPLPKESHSAPWLALLLKPAFCLLSLTVRVRNGEEYLLALLAGHFCESYAFQILLSWLPTYFLENFPNAKGWVFNVVPWVVTMFSSVLSGWLADHMLAKGFNVTFVRKFMETIALCGTAFALVTISYTSSYPAALLLMAIAVACCGFHNSGILVNPQDIAPKHAGAVFGIMNMAGAIPGFVGVYMAGHILEATKSWAAVFNQTAGVCIFGCIVFLIFGTGKQLV